MSTWLAIIGVGAITFLLRASFIVFADPQRFPRSFQRALAYVPPAVLAAIVAPGLLVANGGVEMTLANPRWIAGMVAIAFAARTRSVMAAIVSGMATLWLLQWSLA